MTGLTAQADGAGERQEVLAILLRALVLGGAIGLALLLLSPAIVPLALKALEVPDTAATSADAFVRARFLGAPGALSFYAVNGWLLGLGRTRLALGCQVVMNGVNILLDLVLVTSFGMGARGVGIGTALAEWSALAAGLVAAGHVVGPAWWRGIAVRGLFEWAAMRRLIAVNLDIMVRTLALLLLFTWFTRAGARLGAVELAANHVLMQFVGVSAFVLDGFAFTAEQRVGTAVGAGSRPDLLRAIRLTGEFSLAGGLLFSILIMATRPWLVDFVTHDAEVRRQATAMLAYCAAIPLLGMPSWLLDGIFIGATREARRQRLDASAHSTEIAVEGMVGHEHVCGRQRLRVALGRGPCQRVRHRSDAHRLNRRHRPLNGHPEPAGACYLMHGLTRDRDALLHRGRVRQERADLIYDREHG